MRINCRIIPEPQEDTRSIYKKNERKIEPLIVGEGDLDYICGRCDNVIAQSVARSQIASDAEFQCPYRQTFSEIE